MYKLPAFTDEQIEKLAREHKLFETVYGCYPDKEPVRLMENLKEVNYVSSQGGSRRFKAGM